ncbi:MAG: type VI secretion system ATPase TssH [Polyangiaceae bacterium]
MLIAAPEELTQALHPLCKGALERAAGACWTSGHHELTVEHVLWALLDERGSDFVALCERFRVEMPHLRARVQEALEEQRAGSQRRPVLSPVLLEWFQDALVLACATFGETRIRSGALLSRLVTAPARYVSRPLKDLEVIPRDDLRARLREWCTGSDEAPAHPSAASSALNANRRPPTDASALAQFATNLTEQASQGGLDPVLGRESEVRQVIDILCRRRKNNPLIVGEAGVGKTAIVEGLALRIAAGDVPEPLRDTQLFTLDLGSLQAGASAQGEFQRRLKSVLDEVKASPRRIVLFVDEAHTLIGAGGPQGGGDAANLLKPALARGELRIVAATTWGEYKRYFERDAALDRRFQPVKVEEPSIDQAVAMLRGLVHRFEEAHGVIVRDGALRAAVTLSSRYVTGRQLPDKAVDLLDTASARVKLSRALPSPLEDARARLAMLTRELAALDREEARGHAVAESDRARVLADHAAASEHVGALESDFQAQLGVLDRVDAARAAGARDALRDALADLRAIPRERLLVSADVDEDLVASVISDWTGVPVGRMVLDDVKAALELEERLGLRVRAQEGALSVVGRELRAARSGLKPGGAPLGVFLFVGPSGVGKTETALALADLLFGGERFLVKIDMGEFGEKHTVSRLIGSPPGYVGYGEGGRLTEAVRQRPYSVVLLDEVEKAHPDVMNLFYGVFEKGFLTDGEGRAVDFKNTVVVMTSNLATDLLAASAPPARYEDLVSLVKPALRDFFRPALLGRMTIVPYLPIRPDALGQIVRTKLAAVSERAREAHGVALTFDENVVSTVVSRCSETDAGARNVDHILRGAILPLASGAVLGAMAQGEALSALRVIVDERGELGTESQT